MFKVEFNTMKALQKRNLALGGEIQKVIDTEVLRRVEPYTPKHERVLIDSATTHTRIGSGKVVHRTPYARRLYYNRDYNFRGAPKRGAYWFERMKADHKGSILKEAKREAGIR